MRLPEKTVERLSGYRRTLLDCLKKGKMYIFSHELADLHNITPVQVRRDIMFIGYTSSQKKGYNVKELIREIGDILDNKEGINVAVVGAGNLGTAVMRYFLGKRPKLRIVAAFDNEPSKVNSSIVGVPCYSMDKVESCVKELGITMAIITVPPIVAQDVADKMVNAGIKGILNFSSTPLNISPFVYLEQYDMTTSLEKVAYFVKAGYDRNTADDE